MNLEEWLEKMKEKPDTVWYTEGKPTPKECLICRKALYKRRGWGRSSNLCKSCIDEMAREDAKGEERDPWEINNWDIPLMSNYANDSFISISPIHHKVIRRGDEYDFSKMVYINKEGDIKPVYRDWQKEETELIKQGKVQEALKLMEMHFNELRTLL